MKKIIITLMLLLAMTTATFAFDINTYYLEQKVVYDYTASDFLEGNITISEVAKSLTDEYWPLIERWQDFLIEIEKADLPEIQKSTIISELREEWFKKINLPFIGKCEIDYVSKPEVSNKTYEYIKREVGYLLYDVLLENYKQEVLDRE